MDIGELGQELRPHAIWWAVESFVLTGVTGGVQEARGVSVDWLVLAAVGLGSFLFLWWEQSKTAARYAHMLIGKYNGEDMRRSMRALSQWRKTHQGLFADEFRRRLREQYDEETDTVDRSRRHVSGYFQEVCHCWELHLLTKKHVCRVADERQVEFYRKVVEPLEEALNPAYDRSTFEKLGALYGIKSKLPMTH